MLIGVHLPPCFNLVPALVNQRCHRRERGGANKCRQ
jgi:hypothetical protein